MKIQHAGTVNYHEVHFTAGFHAAVKRCLVVIVVVAVSVVAGHGAMATVVIVYDSLRRR